MSFQSSGWEKTVFGTWNDVFWMFDGITISVDKLVM